MAKRSKKKKASPRAPEAFRSATVQAPRISFVDFASKHWKQLIQALVIVAAGLWVYWPALYGNWLWDDDKLVTDNSQLHSLDGLRQIWFTAPSITTDYWPLSWTVLWIEWHLWGNNPFGYHLCSLALHLWNGFLIWRLFSRFGLREGWLGGLIFVVHPLAVESVAWISEIKNVLSLSLFLLSCDAWFDGEQDRKNSGYLRSILYYLAAMLAKTATVMLPLVLLLYGWWKRGKITWFDVKKTVPYVLIALVLGLITIYFQSHGYTAESIKMGGFFERLLGAGIAACFYLGKFLWPTGLLPIYPRWTLDASSLVEVLPIPLLAALGLGLWTQRLGWGRHVLFGLGFFVLNLLPVLGLVKMMYLKISLVADHFVYLPMIGLIGLVVAILGQAEEHLARDVRSVGLGVVVVIIVLMAWESHRYAKKFIDQETFCTYTLQHNPQAYVAHNNLGVILDEKGRISEAMDHFEQALQLNPDFAEAYYNLGVILMWRGRTPEAIERFEKALRLNPDYTEAHNNLGIALGQQGKISEAIGQFEQALRLDPDYAEAHNNLGNTLLQAGRLPEAIEQCEQALRVKPDYAEAHYNLGNDLLRTGQTTDAIEHYEQALRFKPDYAEAHGNLGIALFNKGEINEAIIQFQEAVRLKPDDNSAQKNLAKAKVIVEQRATQK